MSQKQHPHQHNDSLRCTGDSPATGCGSGISGKHALPPGSGRGARLLITMAINFIIPVAQITGGIFSNSIALISDAVHNFSDFAAILVSYVAYRIGLKCLSTKHTFGLQRAEIIGALLNVIILGCAVVFIVYEAVNRFFHPEPVSGLIVMILAAVGIIGNGISAWILHRDASHNLNIRGAFLHMMGDFLTSVVVLANGAVLLVKPWYWLDPLLSLLIAAFILKNAWTVVKESVTILMNAVPGELELERVQQLLESRPDIHSAHYLHAWHVGSCGIAFTCHLTIDDQMISETETLAEELRQQLLQQFDIDHPVFQFETTACGNATLLCEISDAEQPAEKPNTENRKNRARTGKALEPYFFTGLRIIVGGVFIFAALPKIYNPAAFAETVANYQILPQVLVNPTAIFLPWLELFTGGLIILSIWLESALIIYNLLMLLFISVLTYNTVRGLNIHCGCFSQSSTDIINIGTIIRDSLIIIPSAYLLYGVLFHPRGRRPEDNA